MSRLQTTAGFFKTTLAEGASSQPETRPTLHNGAMYKTSAQETLQFPGLFAGSMRSIDCDTHMVLLPEAQCF